MPSARADVTSALKRALKALKRCGFRCVSIVSVEGEGRGVQVIEGDAMVERAELGGA